MMTSNVMDRQKRFENATCTRGFLKNGGKNFRFQKYPDTCGRGLRVYAVTISYSHFEMISFSNNGVKAFMLLLWQCTP